MKPVIPMGGQQNVGAWSTTGQRARGDMSGAIASGAIASRREWMRGTGAAVSAAALAGANLSPLSLWAQTPAASDLRSAGGDSFSPQIQLAIQRGLAVLVRSQAGDGRFSDARGSGLGDNVAVVALAGLAMLSTGSLPGQGPHGGQVSRCVNYIAAACDQASGLIAHGGSSTRRSMYGHGFATLFLAEVYGTDDREDLQRKLTAATGLIVRSQNAQGGWRYDPRPRDADLSVTICQMMALRAARNAGVFVPGEVISKAVDYVRRCQNPDGGFMYQSTGGTSRYPLTAGAIVALQNAGRYHGKELDDAYDYLNARANGYLSPMRNNYFFYAHYYSAQAFYQRGGPIWDAWYRRLAGAILASQLPDGSWLDYTDRFYATAMAIIILNTPRSLLPIFQR